MKVKKKITDQQTIAETFNEYFIAITKNINRQSKNNLINDDNNNMDSHTYFTEQAFNKTYPSMECKCTTTKEIEWIIKFLKTKNSYGYDEISTKLLKISCPFISSPINYICNKTLFWGVFTLKHLTKVLSTEQYGFRLALRTDNATYKLTNEILNAMNNKLLVRGMFCD